MLLAICTTQVKKRVKKDILKKETQINGTENLLQGDSNPGHENQSTQKLPPRYTLIIRV